MIQIAVSYENFIELIKAKGYEVKGESFDEKSAKYISFKPTCSKNFIRGRDKSLGAESLTSITFTTQNQTPTVLLF